MSERLQKQTEEIVRKIEKAIDLMLSFVGNGGVYFSSSVFKTSSFVGCENRALRIWSISTYGRCMQTFA